MNKTIVDIIIGEMLFDGDDPNEEASKERALSIFVDNIQTGENIDDSDLIHDRYVVTIKNPAQFDLVVDYVSVGASFRMASSILQMTKVSIFMFPYSDINFKEKSRNKRLVRVWFLLEAQVGVKLLLSSALCVL